MLETLYHYLISIIRMLMNPYIYIYIYCGWILYKLLTHARWPSRQLILYCLMLIRWPSGAITKYMHMMVISISFNNYPQLPIISKSCITKVNPFTRCEDGIPDEYKHQKHTAQNKSYSRVLLEPCKTIYRIYWSMHAGFMEQ